MSPPREVACDQCGTVSNVVRASWNDEVSKPVFTCVIKCESCGERTIQVQTKVK